MFFFFLSVNIQVNWRALNNEMKQSTYTKSIIYYLPKPQIFSMNVRKKLTKERKDGEQRKSAEPKIKN